MPNKITITAFVLIVLFYACSLENRKDKASLGKDTNYICFEEIQNLSFTIKTEKLKIQNVPDIISCKGKVLSSPDDIAIVSVPIKGTIKKLNAIPGKFIKKGMTIAIIENSEILKMQEEYLVIRSEYEYCKEDFKRQGELNLENATSMKVMQKAQYEFVKAEARLQSLKKRLELIGIVPDSIEMNTLQSSIIVYAPLSGTVSEVAANLGMFCTVETPLCMISGNQNPILQLYADESKIGTIEEGQLVEFSISTTPDIIYNATIIGIEPNNNTDHIVSIYAQIQKQNENFQIGMPVNADIIAGNQMTLTLPKESIIHRKNETFIIKKIDESCFAITEITIGRTIDNDIEILFASGKSNQTEYVISGAEKIFSKYELELADVR
jgi:membrane fusion protein, heavy metal efflux system